MTASIQDLRRVLMHQTGSPWERNTALENALETALDRLEKAERAITEAAQELNLPADEMPIYAIDAENALHRYLAAYREQAHG